MNFSKKVLGNPVIKECPLCGEELYMRPQTGVSEEQANRLRLTKGAMVHSYCLYLLDLPKSIAIKS